MSLSVIENDIELINAIQALIHIKRAEAMVKSYIDTSSLIGYPI
jgi:hypothetical protein